MSVYYHNYQQAMRSEDDTGADVVMIARASGAALGPSDTNDSRTGGEYTGRDSTFCRPVLCTLATQPPQTPLSGNFRPSRMPVRERKSVKRPGKTEAEAGKGLAGLEKQLRKLGAPLTQAAGVVSFAYACHWQMNVVQVRIY